MNEDNIRTLMRESEIPATHLEVDRLMADSRRSRHRRRVAAVVAVGLAAVGLAVPAVVVANRVTPQPPAGDFAPTTRVVHRTIQIDPAPECTSTPFPVSEPGEWVVDAVDPTGRLVVGRRSADPTVTLWTPAGTDRFTLRGDAPGPGWATAINSDGVVIGFDAPVVTTSFLYRDGLVRSPTTPDGFTGADVVALNGRGDAVGVLSSGSPRAGLVVWPAGSLDRPRVIAEAGLEPLAIRDDGTVIAMRIDDKPMDQPPTIRGDAVVIHRPDGTRLQLDAPAGFGHPSSLAASVVRGDLLYTTYATGETVREPGTPGVRRILRSVRWNLRTGVVEIFDNLDHNRNNVGANANGWFVAYAPGSGAVIVPPDGPARRLPAGDDPKWISADGATRIGTHSTDGFLSSGSAVTWRC